MPYNCELRIANCELRIANCELRIANLMVLYAVKYTITLEIQCKDT